jgi:hypothetical protein
LPRWQGAQMPSVSRGYDPILTIDGHVLVELRPASR